VAGPRDAIEQALELSGRQTGVGIRDDAFSDELTQTWRLRHIGENGFDPAWRSAGANLITRRHHPADGNLHGG